MSKVRKPVKQGKGSEFSTNALEIELPEVAVEPISIAKRNLNKQVRFRFLDFAFDSLTIDSIAQNNVRVNQALRPHICAS